MDNLDDLMGIVNSILPALKERLSLSNVSFNLWFEKFSLLSLDEEKAVFTTPSKMKCRIINQKYIEAVKSVLADTIGFEVEVEVVSNEDNYKFPLGLSYDTERYNELQGQNDDSDDRAEKLTNLIKADTEKSAVIEDYTFDNFIEGSSNKFTKAACMAVADEPGSYNPLFIYSQPGLGKTHLLYAIIHHIKKHHPKLKIVYKKCEDFVNELIEAINQGLTSTFKERYRTADVLLIDDVQFIAGKEATQEEFFHTFSALYESDKQIILTSDRPPKDINPLEDRLRTRFEQDVITDIAPPDLELRVAIIKNKSERLGVEIPQDLMFYMADRLKENVRQIEGVLKKLYAQCSFSGSKKAVTKEVIDNIISVIDPGNIPMDVIIERTIRIVGEYYSVTKEELKSSKRTGNISNARHAAIYIIKKLTPLSLRDIGAIFGRDYTTVIASINKIDLLIKTKKNTDKEISSLIRKVKDKNYF